jgi:hypothetical protein
MLLIDSVLYIGGSFTSYDSEESNYLAAIVYPWSAFVVSNQPQISNSDNVSIYPNPSNGVFNLETNSTIELVELIDMKGVKVWESKQNNGPIKANLKSGVYLLRAISDKAILTRKVVIE